MPENRRLAAIMPARRNPERDEGGFTVLLPWNK